jgi:hypothetical protein
VGVTPEYTELPRNHCPRIESYPEEDRPLTICPPEADPKWRFFWRIVRLMPFKPLLMSFKPLLMS